MQLLQINDFITLYMLPLIPLHFLWTHFLQLVHCIELLPTPLPHTPHGHLTAFCVTFCRSPLIMTLVLFIFTLVPLFSTKSFHSLSLLIRSSSVFAITTKSSAYSDFFQPWLRPNVWPWHELVYSVDRFVARRNNFSGQTVFLQFGNQYAISWSKLIFMQFNRITRMRGTAQPNGYPAIQFSETPVLLFASCGRKYACNTAFD